MSALAVADTAVGLTLAGCAAILVTRRKVRIGALLTGVSAAWFLGDVWSALVFLHRGPMVHLHLSYPTGRLRRWPARVTVVAAYAWAVAEGWNSRPAVTATVAAAIAVAAVDGYLQARGPARRAARPALIAALLFASVLALSAANLLLHWQADRPVALTYDAVMIIVATWLTVDLLRGRWTEDTLADLVTHLGGDPARTGVEAELRRALGDPTLRIAGPDEPVDTTGRAVTNVDA